MPKRKCEEGGLTILLALVLLVTMGAMAFSMSRESFREIAITGNESTGRKAAEAADSGVDWFIAWGNSKGTTTDQKALAAVISDLATAIDREDLRVVGVDATPNVTGTGNMSPAGYLRKYLYSSSTSTDMTFGTGDYTQVTAVQQAFDLEIRYLASVPLTNQGALSQQRNVQNAANISKHLFLIRSLGRANIGTTQSFIAVREAIVEAPPL